MSFAFDPNRYTSIPARTPATMLSLTRALIHAAEGEPSEPIVLRLQTIHTLATTLQTNWIDINLPTISGDQLRTFDFAVDRSWSALHKRIDTWIITEDPDWHDRCVELKAMLFPTGLGFLNLPYAEQWAESERRIELIDRNELAAELDQFTHPKTLTQLRKAHLEYGEALGITSKKPPRPERVRVVDAMRELRAALANYARLVLGLTDESDPVAVAKAEDQLEPILRFRKTPARDAEAESQEELEIPAEPVEAEIPLPPKSS